MVSGNTSFLLNMSGISKGFSGVQVLTDVQFNLCPGEVHILAGENGAGKSTLMKVLGGIYTDNLGTIEIEGKQADFKSVQDATSAGISIIHQELSLIGPLNVWENIFLGKEKSSYEWLDKSHMIEYSRGILKNFDLDIDPKRAVDEFPIGIQQMIEIAKALAFNAKVIVMDEPTSALTAPEVKKLFKIIAQLKEQGWPGALHFQYAEYDEGTAGQALCLPSIVSVFQKADFQRFQCQCICHPLIRLFYLQ